MLRSAPNSDGERPRLTLLKQPLTDSQGALVFVTSDAQSMGLSFEIDIAFLALRSQCAAVHRQWMRPQRAEGAPQPNSGRSLTRRLSCLTSHYNFSLPRVY